MANPFRWPAEWEPHHGTWISWPHNIETWPHLLAKVEQAFVSFVTTLCRFESVYINALDEAHAEHIGNQLEKVGTSAEIFVVPTNDAWARDHGAIFLVDGERRQRLALDGNFNAWGEKYKPYDDDQRVAQAMAEKLDAKYQKLDFVVEGGALDTNGMGTMLSTASALTASSRNPDYSLADLEQKLKQAFFHEQVIWLEGELPGDDTDSHIDNLARFVDKNIVFMCRPQDSAHPLFSASKKNAGILKEHGLDVESLPLPTVVDGDGKLLPASYANFYVANDCVMIPAYDDYLDREVAARFATIWPKRSLELVDSRDVVAGLGSWHCLTQQLPILSI